MTPEQYAELMDAIKKLQTEVSEIKWILGNQNKHRSGIQGSS